MGTNVAPQFANLFMSKCERKLLTLCIDKPLWWIRYIDDILFLRVHGEKKLEEFLEFCQNFQPDVKLDVEIGTEMSYLDMWICKTGNKIETSLYTKPTDLHEYLHFTSCHPTHVTQNLPYGLFLHIKRICSEESDFIQKSEVLKLQLRERGYPHRVIKCGFKKAASKERKEILYKVDNKEELRMSFPLSYYPFFKDFPKEFANTFNQLLENS